LALIAYTVAELKKLLTDFDDLSIEPLITAYDKSGCEMDEPVFSKSLGLVYLY